MAELLSKLFRKAGIPVARVTHVRVSLNNRDLGLYLATEGMNKRFLKNHFKNGEGNLYEGFLNDVHSRLEQDNGAEGDQEDLRRLYLACQLPITGSGLPAWKIFWMCRSLFLFWRWKSSPSSPGGVPHLHIYSPQFGRV